MKQLIKPLLVLGTTSMLAMLTSLLSFKVIAVLYGPSSVGYLGLLQNLLNLALLVASVGVGTGLVRLGAASARDGRHDEVSALRWASAAIFAGAAILGAAVFSLLGAPISRWALGATAGPHDLTLIWVALAFSLGVTLNVGVLNMHHRVGAMARAGLAASVLGAVATVGCALAFGVQSFPWAVALSSALSFFASAWLVRRARVGGAAATVASVRRAAASLLGFGTPYTLSLLVGYGAQLAIPMLVLHLHDGAAVGYHRAAVAISLSYLALLTRALGQDFYPRVSQVSADPARLNALVNQQHTLVLLVALPMILALISLGQWVIPLLFAGTFSPAYEILRWQLVGDVFRFSSWTLGFALLARVSPVTYFFNELAAGCAALAGAWFGLRWFGLAGLGLGFLFTYAVYYTVVWVSLRRSSGFAWETRNLVLVWGGAALAALLNLAPGSGAVPLRSILGVLVTAGVAGLSFVMLRRGWREQPVAVQATAAATPPPRTSESPR